MRNRLRCCSNGAPAGVFETAELSTPGAHRGSAHQTVSSVIEISRSAASRVRKGGERVPEEVSPPALISRDSAAEKPEARWAAEAVEALLRARCGAPRPSRPRDARGLSDWGRSGGHMFPLFHTQPPPYSPLPASLLPPKVLWASPPLHQLSMFLDRNQSVICQLLSIRP